MKKFIQNTRNTVLLFVGSISATLAQDVHFSQMEYSPLTLNPALAGANSPMQGIVNYRNQWNSVAVPYQTIAASFDARFNENSRQKKGIIAGGINFYNDQAGDLKVNTNNVNLNLAYHLILDRTSTLGLGMYGGFGQRSIDPTAARWSNQYDGNDYNAAVGGETINNSNFSYFDVGTGILYSYSDNQGYMNQNGGKRVNVGAAFYHVNQPGYSYNDQASEKLNMRISAFANATFGLNNTRGSILPGVYFQKQKSATEVLFGLYYKHQISEGSMRTGFNKPMSMYFGLFNRLKDAMVAKFILEYDQFSTGFAYDLNFSSLTDVSKARGGFELFLRFNMASGNTRTRI